jgi:hypothetical protein
MPATGGPHRLEVEKTMRRMWIALAGAITATTTALVPTAAHADSAAVTPQRILDTRAGMGAAPGRLVPGAVITLPVAAAAAASAAAVSLNLTATDPAGAGFLTAWPCGQSMPATSVLNYRPGSAVANAITIGLGTGGVCLASSSPVHVVVDLMGWHPAADFRGASPTRVLDTRTTHDPLRAGSESRLSIAAAAGFSSPAGAVALNVTVVSPSAAGFVTVYPCGPRPLASTVNFRAGDIVPNFTLVPYANGEVCLYAMTDTEVVVDSFGWSSNDHELRAGPPARVLDTRSGLGWSGGAARPPAAIELRVAGRGGVPNDAAAALLTVTATGGTAPGYVTVWPCDQTRPVASILNLEPGLLRSNLALAALAADGTVCLYGWTADGSAVDLVADAVGWIPGAVERPAPAPDVPPPSGGSAHFATLPVGSALPSDAECAARVRPAPEVRADNTPFNQTRGHGTPSSPPPGVYSRVTGNFVGTTDEIIQWASCKWGIDEDLMRAQTATESWWHQNAVGDNGESFGLMQVREPYWGWAFNNGVGDARTSSAFNMDAALAARRNCYEGLDSWLNTTDRGKEYAAGDMMGCVGTWFSGRWYTDASVQYTRVVQDNLAKRVWEDPGFVEN